VGEGDPDGQHQGGVRPDIIAAIFHKSRSANSSHPCPLRVKSRKIPVEHLLSAFPLKADMSLDIV
jgi:hypothetical protein